MKRKYFIIFFIILAAILAFGLMMLFVGKNGSNCSGKILFQKSRRQMENKTEEYQTMLPGLWQRDTHIYYRFNADGTGHTWDTDDDVTESDASPFNWQIPRVYHIDAIDRGSLQFHDPYAGYTLTRLNR